MLTVGVEEEFLLLEPDGAVAPVSAGVLGFTEGDDRVRHEYTAYQLETVSGVHTGLDRLHHELADLRRTAAHAAARAGARLVATGAPPLRRGPLETLTDDSRYRRLADRFPGATAAAAGTCGCHVHVGVEDRDLAVGVLGRLRPWLAPLLALTANSPCAEGVDTGYGSVRYEARRHWPTFRAPEVWADAADYDRAIGALISGGTALDVGGVHLLARLSGRFPTIEIRIADTCLNVADTVLFAGIVRALVATLIDDVRHQRADVQKTTAEVERDLAAAARQGPASDGWAFDGWALDGPALHGTAAHGLALDRSALHGPTRHDPPMHGPALHGSAPHGPALDEPALHGPALHGPRSRERPQVAIADQLHMLLRKIGPALGESGDAAAVRAGLGRMRRTGTGAEHQRSLLRRDPRPDAFVAALAARTIPAAAA